LVDSAEAIEFILYWLVGTIKNALI